MGEMETTVLKQRFLKMSQTPPRIKSLIKTGKFCIAIIILKMEENTHLQHIILFLFQER